MRANTATILIFTLCLASLTGNAAKVFGSTPAKIVLGAQSDAYVSEKNPDSCYGTEVILDVRSYFDGTTHFNHRTYIQFDISVLPRNVTIVSAFLWLYKNPEGANPGVRNIQAFIVTEPWDEHTLNWNNQPSISATATTATFVDGAMKWYGWDVTKDVVAWYRGTALNNGTMLRDETEDSKIDYASVFLSRSATHPENPYLEIKCAESNGGSVATGGPIAAEMVKEPWVFGVLLMIIILLAGSGLAIMKKRKREIDGSARRLAVDDETDLQRCHV